MKLFLLAFLCFCGLTAYSVEGVGSEIMRRRFCVSLTSKSIPVQSVKSYIIEEGPMRAVIFVTHKGIKICADPEVTWAKKVMKAVNRRTTLRPSTDRIMTVSGKPTSV
ncbi:cytokine SCM-1 beta-like [Gracilinanus agilis]|uniref:cytokine SCM-1 beta-like n=1 Tax=Gracilinanus agilis TaxID=191870 RepID=UPI001CFF0483|nr:cytokine SCM-1 beta-like [Gracilinanus agilis]